VAAREEGGPFTSLHDFCDRVNMRQINKKTLEALIKAGAFDSTGYTRKHLFALMEECVEASAKRQRDRDSGQVSMFELLGAEEHGFSHAVPAPNGDEWEKKMKLAFEKEMLGIYVSDHPLRDIAEAVQWAADYSLGAVDEIADGTTAWFAGMLSSVDIKPTKKGPLMAVVTLEDLEGGMEAVLFPQTFDKYRDLIGVDNVVRLRAKLEDSDRGKKLIVSEVEHFDGSGFTRPPGRIVVTTDSTAFTNGRVDRLQRAVAAYPGPDVLLMKVADAAKGKTYDCRMPQTVDRHSTALHAELMELFGGESVVEEERYIEGSDAPASCEMAG